jgi:hypothetical protein
MCVSQIFGAKINFLCGKEVTKMNDDDAGLRKVLTALLLVQMADLSESDQINLLIRAGWSNADIAQVCGVTENAIAIRKTRLKKLTK